MITKKTTSSRAVLMPDGTVTMYTVHITADTVADIPTPEKDWDAGSRCDVLENGGTTYLLSNTGQWEEVHFFGDGGGAVPGDVTEIVTEAVAKIVAGAPEDFDTLKEMSDWIANHEDSAAAMNSVMTDIQTNGTGKINGVKVVGTLDSNTDLRIAGKNVTGKTFTINGVDVTAGNGAETFNHSNNIATGENSHAEGSSSTASGSSSHAEGGGTTASGDYSHAEGENTIAAGNHQHVQGKHNVEDSTGKYSFIIGNGTSSTNRSNAFAIDWNGYIYQGNSETGVSVADLAETSEAIHTALVSGENLTSISDLNMITKSGMYKYSGSPTNRPGTQTYGVLLVFNPMNHPFHGNSTYTVQIAFSGVNAAHFGVAPTSGVYVRTTADGGTNWSEWLKLVFADTAGTTNVMNTMEETANEREENLE